MHVQQTARHANCWLKPTKLYVSLLPLGTCIWGGGLCYWQCRHCCCHQTLSTVKIKFKTTISPPFFNEQSFIATVASYSLKTRLFLCMLLFLKPFLVTILRYYGEGDNK